MNTRALGVLTVAVIVTTAIWVAIVIPDTASAGSVDTLSEMIESLGDLDFLFYFNYVNAALITLLDVAMFVGFYLYCRDQDRFWTTVAVAFVPIYGLGNLIAYLSQVFVVPHLLDVYHMAETRRVGEVFLGLTLHTWPGSAVGALNALSYAILGIPSIILGVMMVRKERELRFGGVLLAISGVLSLVAVIGVAVSSPVLAATTLVSGFVFLIGLIPIGVFFLRQPPLEGVY
jgi:hypothetical protein